MWAGLIYNNMDLSDRYEVSDDGHIRNAVTLRILKSAVAKNGHVINNIRISTGTKYTIYIHRAVACTFINNPEDKPQINHKDRNKLNNNRNNLEWSTQPENIIHAYNTGHNGRKLSTDDAMEIRRLSTNGMSIHELARIYNVSRPTISDIINGHSYKPI